MKSVKSLSDLKRVALTSGASVAVGGKHFNADGEETRVVAMPKQAPRVKEEPAPEPTPAPAPPPAPAPVVNVDLTPIAQSQMVLAHTLANALQNLPQPAAPVRKWKFTVHRNKAGFLESFTAEAEE